MLPPPSTDPEKRKARTRLEKRVAKAFGAHNYTPLWAKRLAEIFISLSEDANERKLGVLGLIKRVVEGESK